MVTDQIQREPWHLFIEEWMEERGLTDEILGETMGKSRTTVWRWRTEQNRLNPKKIFALAKAIGCEPEDFWRPPGRPSLDALVKDATDQTVENAAEVLTIFLTNLAKEKRGAA